jgi:nitric oxide reductase subunit B
VTPPAANVSEKAVAQLSFGDRRAFYGTTLFWQWIRLRGDVVFALGASLMA